MRLTSFTDFGLRALMWLAGEPDRVFSTHEIASQFGISRNHLAKIVQVLASGGIVATRRGKAGGIELARPADRITIGEIVRLLEAGQPLVECFRPDGGNCTLTPACKLKGPLFAARQAFLRELDRTTLLQCTYP